VPGFNGIVADDYIPESVYICAFGSHLPFRASGPRNFMKEVKKQRWLSRCAKSFVFKSAMIAAIALSTLVNSVLVKLNSAKRARSWSRYLGHGVSCFFFLSALLKDCAPFVLTA
jgi:hypothetical protein